MSPSNDEFYVGYLNTVPPNTRSRVRRVLKGTFIAGAAMALGGAMLQRDPGSGIWAVQPTSVTGVFRALPYPHLVTETPTRQSILLLCQGKHAPGPDSWCGPAPEWVGAPGASVGALVNVDALDGHRVTATGLAISRSDGNAEGLQALELAATDGSITVLDTPAEKRESPAAQEVGVPGVFEGEIVDPKCYLGVMKPGEGRAHRACAWLCIKGGIPPVLMIDDSHGRHALVLASAEGASAKDLALEFVGDRVSVRGRVIQRDGLTVLRVFPGEIQRVP